MSTKTVAGKLLVKPGTSVWVSHPDGGRCWTRCRPACGSSTARPTRAWPSSSPTTRSRCGRCSRGHRDTVTAPPVVWVAYPKGGRTDINRDSLWPIVGEFGVRPSGQVAIDDVWSALRFRAVKPGEPPFTGGAK